MNGTSNGLVIVSPFTVEVHGINNYKSDELDCCELITCVKTNGGDPCECDELVALGYYGGRKKIEPAFGLASSKQNDLTNSLEADLDAAFGQGNWS